MHDPHTTPGAAFGVTSEPDPRSLPLRIRLLRKKGWRLPAGARKVDRSTVFGNPFVPGEPNGLGFGVVRDVEHAVWLYRHWLTTPHRSIVFEADRHKKVLTRLPGLTGKHLACWCTPGAPCHGDVLLDLANRPNLPAWVAVMTGPHGPGILTDDELQTAVAQLAARRGIDTSNQAAVQRIAADVMRHRGIPPADRSTP